MNKEKLKKIEAKIQLGLPITKKEKSYYLLFTDALDLGIVCNMVI